MTEYGNTGWQVFVYGTYAFVTLVYCIYVSFSLRKRNKALKSLQEEGFLEESKE